MGKLTHQLPEDGATMETPNFLLEYVESVGIKIYLFHELEPQNEACVSAMSQCNSFDQSRH
jgi:hypothetical protein